MDPWGNETKFRLKRISKENEKPVSPHIASCSHRSPGLFDYGGYDNCCFLPNECGYGERVSEM